MIPVKDLYAACEKMLADKWGYIWGTSGIKWTQARQDAVSDEMARKYGSRWIGHMVADCSGVMIYIWRLHGLSIAHGSNSIARKYCGEMRETPEPGFAAFKWRKTDTSKYPDEKGDYYHVGIVAANGRTVYESRGTQTGFVISAASSWHSFAPFRDVDYAERTDGPVDTTPYEARVTTESGRLNLRAAPGTNAKIKAQLERGCVVTVVAEDGGWSRVSYAGVDGWVSSKYLTPVNASKTPVETPDAQDGETSTPEPGGASTGLCVRIPCADMAKAQALITLFGGQIINGGE